MRRFQLLCLTLLLCVFAGFAHADSAPGDPTMVVNDPTCDGPCPVTAGVPFTFQANSAGGGTFSFEVNPGGGLSSLEVETFGTFANTSDVHCSNSLFLCTVNFIGDVTDIYFTPCTDCNSSGIPAGHPFSIDLDDPGTPGVGGWGADRQFTAEADVNGPTTTPFITPEPSTLCLMATGIAGFAGRKRLFRKVS